MEFVDNPDDIPPHFANAVRDFLNEKFPWKTDWWPI